MVVTGAGTPGLLSALDRMPNVRAVSLEGSDEQAQAWASRRSETYVAHDHDPLGHVAAAWVEFFEDEGTLGTLQLEIERTVDALEAGRVNLPDYYLVLQPETLADTWRHWWLGVLAEAAPTRVIPWSPESGSLPRMLRRLPTGRPWPAPRRWLGGLPTAVPDRVGLDHRSA